MNKSYHCNLTFAKKRGDYFLFGLPQTNRYHQIGNYSFAPEEPISCEKVREDSTIAAFALNDVKDDVRISFDITPYAVSLSPPHHVDHDRRMHEKLLHDQFINGEDKQIVNLATSILKGEQDTGEIVRRCYSFVLEYLTYGNPTEGLYTYKQAMEERTTDCGGYSTLLASLLQSQGIPTRLVVGFIINDHLLTRLKNVFTLLHLPAGGHGLTFERLLMHAWLEAKVDRSQWFPLDPSMEWRRRKGLTRRSGGFGIIPADRMVTSFGHNFALKLNSKNYHFDLLQHPFYV